MILWMDVRKSPSHIVARAISKRGAEGAAELQYGLGYIAIPMNELQGHDYHRIKR